MGGNFLLKLNIDSRPIAKKYREGKVKRTLKRELKVPEIAERKSEWNQFLLARLSCSTERGGSCLACQRRSGLGENCSWIGSITAVMWNLLLRLLPWLRRRLGVKLPNLASCNTGLPVLLLVWSSAHMPSACWLNGFIRPVLKHGPRSLTYVRVCGWQTCMRNESDCWDICTNNRPSNWVRFEYEHIC